MDEFWTMHPLQFNALRERSFRSTAEWRAFFANVFGCKKEDDAQYSSEDFMPKMETEEDKSSGWDKLCAEITAFAALKGSLKGA